MDEVEIRTEIGDVIERFLLALEAAMIRAAAVVPTGNNRLLRFAVQATDFGPAPTPAATRDRLRAATSILEAYAAADESTLRRAIARGTVDVWQLAQESA